MTAWQRYGVRHPVRVALLCGATGVAWTRFNDFNLGWAIIGGALVATIVWLTFARRGFLARKFPIEYERERAAVDPKED